MTDKQQDDKPEQPRSEDRTEDRKSVPDRSASDKTRTSKNNTGKQKSRRFGSVLATFLLLLLLAALAAGGWFGTQWILTERASLQQRLHAQETDLRELRDELQRLQETAADQDELEAIGTASSATDAELDARMQQLERSMNDLRDAAEGGRRALMQAEIEYLLRIAADELYLTTDIEAASYALQAADERLRQLADPRFNPVRALIAEHLSQLNTVSIPDIPGMAFKLGSLQRTVDELPLAQQHYAEMQAGEDAVSSDESWWRRFQSGLDRLYGKLVTLQPAEPPKPLLAPEDSFFLRRNLELQFATARAALLRQDANSYRQSLEMARGWLTEYFDQNDAEVKGVLADLNGLLAISLQPELPDVTSALTTFREINGNGVRD